MTKALPLALALTLLGIADGTEVASVGFGPRTAEDATFGDASHESPALAVGEGNADDRSAGCARL